MKKLVLFLLLFLPMLITKASPPLFDTSEKIVLNADNGAITIDFILLDINNLQESEVGFSPHLTNVNGLYINKITVNLLKEQKPISENFDYSKNSFLVKYKNISYDYNLNKKVVYCNSINKWLMYR